MKKKTKALVVVLCTAAIALGSVFGTMAYLVDSKTATNTFTVGDVKIDLDEAKVTNMGVVDGTDRVKANTYKLLPGHSYVKDPTVTVVKGSEECYVRILVTIDNKENIDKLFPKQTDEQLKALFTGYSTDWVANGAKSTNTERTYEFRYTSTVKAAADKDEKLAPLFTGIKVPGDIDGTQLATLNNTHITIVAEAIQADGFENNADGAWAAFEQQMAPKA